MKNVLNKILRYDLITGFILFILINGMFFYKYGIRQQTIPIVLLLAVYAIFIVLFTLITGQIKLKPVIFRVTFFTLATLTFFLSIAINKFVDGYALRVDRWSAMDAAITALISGKYPYLEMGHMEHISSNLTSILVMGFPFYLLGDVGYLQCFSFLFFTFVIYRTLVSDRARLLALCLLLFSITFLWEVYAKSDLMTNFMFITGFICLWFNRFGNERLEKPLLLGFLAAFLFYTRVVSIIPLCLFLLQPFVRSSVKKKVLFLAGGLVTLLILTLIVLKDWPGWEIVKHNNPISVQNLQLPFAVSLGTVLLPIFFSFGIKRLETILFRSIIFLFIPVLISFSIAVNKFGFYMIFHESTFDISYFNVSIPFLVILIAKYFDQSDQAHAFTKKKRVPEDPTPA